MNALPAATTALVFAAAAAFAQAPPAGDEIPRLKAQYLACDEEATHSVLDAGSAMRCSQIAEALKQRAFDGDFERLLQWWRSAKLDRARIAAAATR